MFKKIFLFIMMVLFCFVLGACSSRKLFSISKNKTVKIMVQENFLEHCVITEKEDIKAMSKIFRRREAAKMSGSRQNDSKFTYCINCYDKNNTLYKYFYLDPETGELYKIGSYSEFDIFKTNHYYLSNLHNDELELFLSIVEKYVVEE